MPESPEVDALAGFLRAQTVGRSIRAIELDEFRALKTRGRPLDGLVGGVVEGVERHGKHVSFATDRGTLVVSFGRAGWATWTETTDATGLADSAGPEADAAAPPEIARLTFEADRRGGEEAVLALTDAGEWLSLGLSVVDDPADVPAVAALGPDAASPDYAAADLDRALGTRRKQLKALLQEQESLAGIGNAYSDEILHAARLSPVAHAASLTAEERERLYTAVREVLGGAVAARRDIPIARQKAEKVASMRVHGRTGLACPVCGDTVRDVPKSKGGAQYCPTCQTGGVPLPE